MGGCEGALFVVEDAELFLLEEGADLGLTVEVVAQLFVDCLKHPVFRLFVALALEIAGLFYIGEVAVDHIPHFVNVEFIISAVGHDLRNPFAGCWREQMQCIAELSRSKIGTFYIVAVRFVDYDSICHLHDSAFDALQLISCAGKLD